MPNHRYKITLENWLKDHLEDAAPTIWDCDDVYTLVKGEYNVLDYVWVFFSTNVMQWSVILGVRDDGEISKFNMCLDDIPENQTERVGQYLEKELPYYTVKNEAELIKFLDYVLANKGAIPPQPQGVEAATGESQAAIVPFVIPPPERLKSPEDSGATDERRSNGLHERTVQNSKKGNSKKTAKFQDARTVERDGSEVDQIVDGATTVVPTLECVLNEAGLSHLLDLFNEQGITVSILGDLTDGDLKELGIVKLGERKRILAAFAKADRGLVASSSEVEEREIPVTQDSKGQTKSKDKSRKTASDGELQNPDDLFNLGSKYHDGEGVPQDYIKAAEFYRQAAEQGHAKAQNCLGVMYGAGKGVAEDREEAVKWYRKSAEQGFAWAQFNLGKCYWNGDGVINDEENGLKLMVKAAEQGVAKAQTFLGDTFGKFWGFTRDDPIGYREADAWRGDCVQAEKWYRMAAEQGDVYGQCQLGRMYLFGVGLAVNVKLAAKWLRKAYDGLGSNDNINHSLGIGDFLAKALVLSSDPSDVKEGFRIKEELFSLEPTSDRAWRLADDYAKCTPQDLVNVEIWFEKSFEIESHCFNELLWFYAAHNEKDKWIRTVERAAERGQTNCAYMAGSIFELGRFNRCFTASDRTCIQCVNIDSWKIPINIRRAKHMYELGAKYNSDCSDALARLNKGFFGKLFGK